MNQQVARGNAPNAPRVLLTLGKEQIQTTDVRYEILDREVNRLALLMEQLVDSSRVDTNTGSTTSNTQLGNKTQDEKDGLQLAVTASSMVDSCQNLLRLTSELQNSYLFYDYKKIEEAQSQYLTKLKNEQSQM